MFKPFTILASLTLAFALGTAPAGAQSLDGNVVRNPDDTVTYGIHLDGPPNGRARLYVSLYLLLPPYQSSIGPLWIDPTWWMPIGPFLQLPPTGQAQLQFTVPADLTAGLPLSFQTINIDTRGILRLSNNAVVLGHNRPVSDCNLTHQYTYDTDSETIDIFGTGPAGAIVTVRVENALGVVEEWDVTVDENGEWSLREVVPDGIHRGDRIEIDCDGVQVDTIRVTQ